MRYYPRAIILSLILFTMGCTPVPEDTESLTIVATIFPFKEFVQEVGDNQVRAVLLLPPGADAHSYEPRPSDILLIGRADLFVYVGAGMEPWAQDLVAHAKNISVVDASTRVILREADDEHGGLDPHFWLDFAQDRKIVDAIATALGDRDPENRQWYRENAARYNDRLAALDEEYQRALADCRTRTFITNHESFGYLAARYNLTAVAIYGVTTSQEPSPKRMKEIADLVRANQIKYIFFESLVSPRVATALARETGAETLVLNPGHNLLKGEDQSFIDIMETNLAQLMIGLECP